MNNTDFLTVEEIKEHDIVKVDYIDFEYDKDINKFDSRYSTLNISPFSKTVKLNKNYNKNINLLKEFIDKILEISNIEEYPEILKEFKTLDGTYNEINTRKLITKCFSCSNYIATNGRIGAANFMIIPYRYLSIMQYHIIDNMINGILIIPTNLIKDIIIIGRKNRDTINPGIYGFYNKNINKYTIEPIGNAQYQYHILKVTSLQDERRKKLEKIEKNKYQIRN